MNELLTAIPPNLPSTWFTAERLEEFWGYVKWTLMFNMPIIMIVLAALLAGAVLDTIINIFDTRAKRKDEDDDGYEERHY